MKTKKEWSEIAKRAWITRKSKGTNKIEHQGVRNNTVFNGKTNPYPYGTSEYRRLYYYVSAHGKLPPENRERVYKTETKRVRGNNDALSPAQKAWVTRRQNDPKLSVTKSYNTPKKNEFREIVTDSFMPLKGRCLALESPDFLFVRKMRNTKFVIYENNKVQFRKMMDVRVRPPNIESLMYGDVKKFASDSINGNFTCAWLDFCNTFQSNEATLYAIAPKLSSCEKIALTFAVRVGNLKKDRRLRGDYRMALLGRILEMFPNYKLEYPYPYRDGAAMVSVILTKKEDQPTDSDGQLKKMAAVLNEVYSQEERKKIAKIIAPVELHFLKPDEAPPKPLETPIMTSTPKIYRRSVPTHYIRKKIIEYFEKLGAADNVNGIMRNITKQNGWDTAIYPRVERMELIRNLLWLTEHKKLCDTYVFGRVRYYLNK